MINCAIVGGEVAKNLAKYINVNSGGSIVVSEDNIFEEFSSDRDILKGSYIKVSKLIYLIDETHNIKEDITVLYELIQNRALFNIGELWVFGKETEENFMGQDLLCKILIDLDFENYQIRLTEDDPSFSDIYKEITGVIDAEDYRVPYVKVYRTEIGDDSKVGYDPTPYRHNIKLLEEDRVGKYEKMKESSKKSENNIPIKEEPSSHLPNVHLDIKAIKVDDVIYKSNIFVVCGFAKAGTSVFASNLALSLSVKHAVNMIDISKNCGSARNCIRLSKSYTLVKNKELLTGKDFSNHCLTIYTSAEIKDLDTKFDYLKYILSSPNRTKSDYIVIDCDISQLEEICKICNIRMNRVFLCCQSVKDELMLLDPYIEYLSKADIKTLLYLNNSIMYDDSYEKIDAIYVKDYYKDLMVINPINFKTRKNLYSLINL